MSWGKQRSVHPHSTTMKPSVRVVLLCLGYLCCGSSACGNDWTQYGESCYAFIDELVTWSTATAICSSLRAGLVEVNSKAENDFVAAQLRARSLSACWMGIQDFLREGRWVTTSNDQPLEFKNWRPGEPNNKRIEHEGGEDCGVLQAHNGLWNDYACDHTHAVNVVCEYLLEEEPPVG